MNDKQILGTEVSYLPPTSLARVVSSAQELPLNALLFLAISAEFESPANAYGTSDQSSSL